MRRENKQMPILGKDLQEWLSWWEHDLLITRTVDLGFYQVINLKGGGRGCITFGWRWTLQLLLPLPVSYSCFSPPPSCQCNMQPVHTSGSYVPLTPSLTTPSPRSARVPHPPTQSLPPAFLLSQAPKWTQDLESAWQFCIFMVYWVT